MAEGIEPGFDRKPKSLIWCCFSN